MNVYTPNNEALIYMKQNDRTKGRNREIQSHSLGF